MGSQKLDPGAIADPVALVTKSSRPRSPGPWHGSPFGAWHTRWIGAHGRRRIDRPDADCALDAPTQRTVVTPGGIVVGGWRGDRRRERMIRASCSDGCVGKAVDGDAGRGDERPDRLARGSSADGPVGSTQPGPPLNRCLLFLHERQAPLAAIMGVPAHACRGAPIRSFTDRLRDSPAAPGGPPPTLSR